MKRIQPLLYSPKGYAKPPYARDRVRQAFADVRQWYVSKLGLAPYMNVPLSFAGRQTWAEIGERYGGHYLDNGFNIWRDAMLDIKSRGVINFCNNLRGLYLIYFHPPLAELEGNPIGMGGMVGNENWGCVNPRPGTACMGDRMTYLLAGKTSDQIEAAGWPPAWPNSPNHPRGGIAHEILHMFTDLPHAEGQASITSTWYYWPDVGFTEAEAAVMRAALA